MGGGLKRGKRMLRQGAGGPRLGTWHGMRHIARGCDIFDMDVTRGCDIFDMDVTRGCDIFDMDVIRGCDKRCDAGCVSRRRRMAARALRRTGMCVTDGRDTGT